MELKGTIKKINELQTFASGFQKQDVVILTDEQYPQPVLVEFLSDKTELLKNVKEGDSVTAHINIRGREWTNPQGEVKYFNSITVWKLDKGTNTQNAPVYSGGAEKPINPSTLLDEESDDLPF